MSGTHIMAIDQGTTGSTVLVFDRAGSIAGRGYSEFTQHYPKPGWVEHDAGEIWAVTQRVMQAALDDAGIAPRGLDAIGITNQRETIVLWDRATGEPVHRAIVWQDRRTAAACDALKAAGHEDRVRAKTGLLLDPYFSATKLQWLLDRDPAIRARAEAGELAFGTIDSWLLWNLTGGAAHATDYSNASRTLLYNIHELAWDDELLALFQIPRALLPEVRPSSHVYGTTHASTFADYAREGADKHNAPAVPIAGIAGDQQAALFGQACYGEGRAKNTYGTGSFLLMNTGTTPAQSENRLLTTIAWGIGDEAPEYALEGAIFVTGSAVQWLRDGLGIIEHASETEALARSLDTNDDVYFVPALTGLGAPHWDPYARGTIVGLTRGATKAHIARAVLESIAYQTRDIVQAMERDAGTPLRELRADGGAAGNAWLMQFQSDILGVPVDVPAITETTALGAAYLAGLATGFWSGRDEIDAKWKRASSYAPSMPEDERTRLHGRWQRAVERAKSWAEE